MDEQFKILERGRKENIKGHMEDMRCQVDLITSQVSTLEKQMAAIEAYGQPPSDDDDFGESASDIVIAATRKRRRDEDDDPEPVVASEQEVAYVRARDRNFEMSFVRSESPTFDTSRTARSETFGREEEDDERPSKRQRSDDQESISDGWVSDEELYVGEPTYHPPVQVSDERVPAPVEVREWYSYPSSMQVSDERVPAPMETGEWSQWPVRSAGMQNVQIFPENGLAQYLSPPLSRQEVFQAQFEGAMTDEHLADYPLAQHTNEAEPDAPSGSAFVTQRECTQDVSDSIENDSLSYRSTPDYGAQREGAEAGCSTGNTEQSTDLQDLASYYERVAELARQPEVAQYIRRAFADFDKHKEKHSRSRITAADVRRKLRFVLEREVMVPSVDDWSSYSLPVDLILADPKYARGAIEHMLASDLEGSYNGSEFEFTEPEESDGDDSFQGFEDNEEEMPESDSAGVTPPRSPQEDAAAVVEALKKQLYTQCASTWDNTREHTCGILDITPWTPLEEAHWDETKILKHRLSLQEKYDRCASQWPMFGSHTCGPTGEDRSVEDLWIPHASNVKSMQDRKYKYEACIVLWSIYGRHTCGVEEESESDQLQEHHLVSSQYAGGRLGMVPDLV